MASEEPTAAQVAEALVGGAIGLRRSENLVVESWSHTLPYAAACVVEARRRGARPVLLVEDEGAYWRSVESLSSPASWAKVGSHEWALLREADAYVFFPGPADGPRFRALPEPTRSALVGYNAEWYRRAEKGRLRGVRSLLGYASDARAALWGANGSAWRRQLAEATVRTDLKGVGADARRASRLLAGTGELRVTAANGTDLRLRLVRRAPIADDGVISPDDLRRGNNMTISPPGAVAVAVDERSAQGVAIANRASFLPTGKAEGGQWEFDRGRLTNHWYTDGAACFDEPFAKGGKGRDQAGFFSIGLNPHLGPGVPMVEDQEAGAVTIGVGGNVAYGGTNRGPFTSWIVIGEATVAVDGRPLCDRGKIL